MNEHINPIEDLVGDLFVDRQYELNLFWQWATGIPHPLRNSFALIGRRRTGKTATLVKLFNRLFHEQEAVLPVFISFAHYLNRAKPLTSYEFGRDYLTGYMASYLAFRYREPKLFESHPTPQDLRRFAQEVGDQEALAWVSEYESMLQEHIPHGLVQWVINLPRREARFRQMPTAVIVDEFQVLTNVYDPKQNVFHDITDSFQRAVETKWAPMLVAGSAVSLLMWQASGGMLSGRLKYCYLEPLSREFTHELVFRLGEKTGLLTTEAFAEAMWQFTGGYPYAIESLMGSLCDGVDYYPLLDALEEVILFELTDPFGQLWHHYSEEFTKYSDLLNEGQTTKKVLFWATKYPEERINAKEIAQKIGVSVAEVQKALHKLHQADMVKRVGWTLYEGLNDPMLRRYIEYNYRQEIEELSASEASKDWKREYKQLRGKMNQFIGEVAEVYVQALMRAFDDRSVEGSRYFNQTQSITLPAFEKLERRTGIVKKGLAVEIDILGEWKSAQGEQCAWLVQVKNTQAPISEDKIKHFLAQIEQIKAEKNYAQLIPWYMSKQGFTANATIILQKEAILFSNREQFNALAKQLGFVGLPP